MKKLISLLMAFAMLISLCACGDTAPANSADGYTVAIVKQLDHPSMDEIANAIEGELVTKLGDKVAVNVYSGQNDSSVLAQIGSQINDGKTNVIIPIGTLAAQCMATACDGKNIPVVFAAVSDPEAGGLTGLDFVTGTSDALNVESFVNMMLAVNPGIKTIGLLYSLSEANSISAIASINEILSKKGIKAIEKTGNTTDEVVAAAQSLATECDAVFTPTDNTVMAAEAAVAEILANAGVPHYAGADSFVTSGAFATCGVNYTELGIYTADMAVEALSGNLAEIHVMDGGIITVNKNTAKTLGIDYSCFADMGNLIEVE